MGFRINTNILSLNAQRNLGINSKAFAKALQRLSSGSRINRAGDDAAGLAISEGLGAQVRGTAQAIRNSNEAIGFLNTAEGALAELTNITQRLRELAIQASNGTLSSTERTYLDSEKTQLINEFDRISTQTQFNGAFLLDGSFTTTDLQVGIQKGMTISFNIGNARASALGGLATLSGLRNLIQTAISGLIINGVAINNSVAGDDTVSTGNNSFSAISIAKRINEQSGQTKVYADLQTTIVQVNSMDFSGYSSGDLSQDNFKINDTSVLGTGINNVNSFIAAVNNYSSTTGVKARLQANATNSIEFYADDGRNIEIFFSSVSNGALHTAFANSANMSLFSTGTIFSAAALSAQLSTQFSAVGLIRTGAIKLRSSSAITISNMSSGALGFAGATTSTASITVDATQGLSTILLTTQQKASDALSVVDATLTSLNTLRSGLGATQSRLDSVINSLGITLENISGARSQIRDTDVASETAELTRAQILQEAGVAVLGQANSNSQSALRLLQNL